MSQSKPIKVMIVDDHPVVRTGLTAVLHAFDDLDLVGEAGSGAEALAKCQESLPDVILMDMLMPDMDGLETTIAVLDQYPDVKIVVLTSFPEDDLVHKAMEAGAVGYLLKNAPIHTLAEAIRSASVGQTTLAPEATQALIRARTGHQQPGHDLSERERQVLALVVGGLSNAEIALQLSISPDTVKHHVSACISKLGAANRAQAAALAVEYQITSKLGSTV
jgi:NarL family two-component system response regulator LiaR